MEAIELDKIKTVIEAVLMSAGEPITLSRLMQLFEDHKDTVDKNTVKNHLTELEEDYKSHSSLELKELASGYCFRVRSDFSPWIAKFWEIKPQRYSRALLETLALIAYRQPITRAEIEKIRGVAVSSNIIRTLMERDWIKVIGHRDIPGKPGLYGTTKKFLDHFNLKGLDELPSLPEIQDLTDPNLEFEVSSEIQDSSESDPELEVQLEVEEN